MNLPQILPHSKHTPKLGKNVFLAPSSFVIGDVEVGDDTSFWFHSVTRGDVHSIRIGSRSNVQDLSMLHVSYLKASLSIGDDVTIGHSCILHGCTLKNRILVGMGSLIMDHALIEDDVIIGAGSLVTEKMHIPSGKLVFGRPAKIIRDLSEDEKTFIKLSARHYVKVAASYQGGEWPYNPQKD